MQGGKKFKLYEIQNWVKLGKYILNHQNEEANHGWIDFIGYGMVGYFC